MKKCFNLCVKHCWSTSMMELVQTAAKIKMRYRTGSEAEEEFISEYEDNLETNSDDNSECKDEFWSI